MKNLSKFRMILLTGVTLAAVNAKAELNLKIEGLTSARLLSVYVNTVVNTDCGDLISYEDGSSEKVPGIVYKQMALPMNQSISLAAPAVDLNDLCKSKLSESVIVVVDKNNKSHTVNISSVSKDVLEVQKISIDQSVGVDLFGQYKIYVGPSNAATAEISAK